MLPVTLSLLLLTALSGLAQSATKKPVKPEAKKEPEIKEELTLKNDDKLTGQLLNSTGTEIKFKSDLAGEVTVKVGERQRTEVQARLRRRSQRLKEARNSAIVPQGAINIGEKGVIVSPISTTKPT